MYNCLYLLYIYFFLQLAPRFVHFMIPVRCVDVGSPSRDPRAVSAQHLWMLNRTHRPAINKINTTAIAIQLAFYHWSDIPKGYSEFTRVP